VVKLGRSPLAHKFPRLPRARSSPTSSRAFGRGDRSRRDERKAVTCRTNRRAADRPGTQRNLAPQGFESPSRVPEPQARLAPRSRSFCQRAAKFSALIGPPSPLHGRGDETGRRPMRGHLTHRDSQGPRSVSRGVGGRSEWRRRGCARPHPRQTQQSPHPRPTGEGNSNASSRVRGGCHMGGAGESRRKQMQRPAWQLRVRDETRCDS